MDRTKLKALSLELSNLLMKINIFKSGSQYIYPAKYRSWLSEYNAILKKYNEFYGLEIYYLSYSESDLSATKKTVREASIACLEKTIENLAIKIDVDVEEERRLVDEKNTPTHQMRKCFKIGVEQCPKRPILNIRQVFIAMPFCKEFEDVYQFGIVETLNSLGYKYIRADKELSSHDIMCKICQQMQSSNLIIADISDHNPNVMLEMGMAFGLGKSVIVIKDKKTAIISDISGLEYIEYEHLMICRKDYFED